MRTRPAIEIAIGLRVPELVRREAQQHPVDDQTAILVAGEAIPAAIHF